VLRVNGEAQTRLMTLDDEPSEQVEADRNRMRPSD